MCSQGEPIPEDKRTLIFRRFYRDDSARSSTNGYGLGLAIAAETARSHRARIGVEYKGWDELLLCDGEKEESVKEGGIKKENGILL